MDLEELNYEKTFGWEWFDDDDEIEEGKKWLSFSTDVNNLLERNFREFNYKVEFAGFEKEFCILKLPGGNQFEKEQRRKKWPNVGFRFDLKLRELEIVRNSNRRLVKIRRMRRDEMKSLNFGEVVAKLNLKLKLKGDEILPLIVLRGNETLLDTNETLLDASLPPNMRKVPVLPVQKVDEILPLIVLGGNETFGERFASNIREVSVLPVQKVAVKRPLGVKRSKKISKVSAPRKGLHWSLPASKISRKGVSLTSAPSRPLVPEPPPVSKDVKLVPEPPPVSKDVKLAETNDDDWDSISSSSLPDPDPLLSEVSRL